jgi:hypothetical protein
MVTDADHSPLTYFTHRYVSTETIDVLNTLDGISMITGRNLAVKWKVHPSSYLGRLLPLLQFGTDDAFSRSSLSYSFNIRYVDSFSLEEKGVPFTADRHLEDM